MVRREVIAMISFLNNIDPIILDVAIVSILVLITSFGAIRGIKKVSINVLLLSVSLFLGFCPYTNSLKKVVSDKLFKVDNLAPAGSGEMFKFAISLIVPLFSALVIFLLFYMVLFSLRLLIGIIIKKKSKGFSKPKSKVGRVFAGLISFAYSLTLMLLILTASNTNMVGMNKSIDKSTVVKFAVENSEKLFVKIDEQFKEKLFIKVLSGDVLKEVKDKDAEAFSYFDEKVLSLLKNKEYFENISTALTIEEGRLLAKEKINDLYQLSILTNCFMNEFNSVQEKFVILAEAGFTSINRLVKSNQLGQIEFSINDFTVIKKNFKELGVREEVLAYLDEIVIQN